MSPQNCPFPLGDLGPHLLSGSPSNTWFLVTWVHMSLLSMWHLQPFLHRAYVPNIQDRQTMLQLQILLPLCIRCPSSVPPNLGKPVPERQNQYGFERGKRRWGIGDAVKSAGPYVNNLHLAPDRLPDALSDANQQIQSTEGSETMLQSL